MLDQLRLRCYRLRRVKRVRSLGGGRIEVRQGAVAGRCHRGVDAATKAIPSNKMGYTGAIPMASQPRPKNPILPASTNP